MRRQFTFNHEVPRIFGRLFDEPWMDEKLNQLWKHRMVSNSRPLNCESSLVTTRPLLHKSIWENLLKTWKKDGVVNIILKMVLVYINYAKLKCLNSRQYLKYIVKFQKLILCAKWLNVLSWINGSDEWYKLPGKLAHTLRQDRIVTLSSCWNFLILFCLTKTKNL